MKISKLLICLLALGSFSAAHAATSCSSTTTPSTFTGTTTQCSFGNSHGKESASAPNTTLVSFPITTSGNYTCSLSNIAPATYTDVKANISLANGATMTTGKPIQKLSMSSPLTISVTAGPNGSGDIQVQLLQAKKYTAHSIGITCNAAE